MYTFTCAGKAYSNYMDALDAAEILLASGMIATVTMHLNGTAIKTIKVDPAEEELIRFTVFHTAGDSEFEAAYTPQQLYELWWDEDCPLPAGDDPVLRCSFAGVAMDGLNDLWAIINTFCGTEQKEDIRHECEALGAFLKKEGAPDEALLRKRLHSMDRAIMGLVLEDKKRWIEAGARRLTIATICHKAEAEQVAEFLAHPICGLAPLSAVLRQKAAALLESRGFSFREGALRLCEAGIKVTVPDAKDGCDAIRKCLEGAGLHAAEHDDDIDAYTGRMEGLLHAPNIPKPSATAEPDIRLLIGDVLSTAERALEAFEMLRLLMRAILALGKAADEPMPLTEKAYEALYGESDALLASNIGISVKALNEAGPGNVLASLKDLNRYLREVEGMLPGTTLKAEVENFIEIAAKGRGLLKEEQELYLPGAIDTGDNLYLVPNPLRLAMAVEACCQAQE